MKRYKSEPPNHNEENNTERKPLTQRQPEQTASSLWHPLFLFFNFFYNQNIPQPCIVKLSLKLVPLPNPIRDCNQIRWPLAM